MNIVLYSPDNPIAFYIFNFPIRFYGIFLSLAIFIGIAFAYFTLKKLYSKKEAELLLDILPIVIIFSIIGARLFYIFSDLKFYLKNPNEIIMINHGGLSIFGALTAGIISFYIISKKHKINFFKYADIIACALPLSQAIGRWGNFFNQEAYGLPSEGIIKLYIDTMHRKAQYIDSEYYHPTFLYESFLNLFVFVLLVTILFKFKNIKQGSIFLIYLMCYSLLRFFVESIRIDSLLYIFSMPVAQVICIIVFLTSALVLIKINLKNKTEN